MKTLLLLLVVCYVEVRADEGDGYTTFCPTTESRKDSIDRILRYCSACHIEDVLFAAVKANDYLTTTDLLEDGANVDATDVYNYTPLIWAASNGLVKVGRILLEYGANVEARVSTAVHKTALDFAAQQGSVEFCRLLLENGADLESLEDFRQSPVFYSATYGNLNATKYLVGKGAKLDIKNVSGKTPEETAALYVHPEVAAWLASVK